MMKLFIGFGVLSLGLVLATGTANAQVSASQEGGRPSYRAVSDFNGPYGAAPEIPPYAPMPPQPSPYAGPPPYPGPPPYAAAPPEIAVPAYPAYSPGLLPPREIYAILRETGFVPLGVPRQRGFFYVIAAADRYGAEGRLVIDARTGRIIRFVPAYGAGDIYGAAPVPYGVPGRAPVMGEFGVPRPPAALPKMASRSPAPPIPRAAPPRAIDEKPLVEKPLPAAPQQSAQVQTKPADAPAVTHAAPAPTAEAKPTPQIQPTQPMPSVQDLE
jgi:hypothetical protein